MKFVVFSGTTEGRRLSSLLAEAGAEVTVCVATEYGSEAQGCVPGVTILQGPMSPEQKQSLLQGAALCVDATHPYAAHVSSSIRNACREAGVSLVRLLRRPCDPGDALCFPDADAAARWLAEQDGNILLTTGAKEISSFSGLDPSRLFPRILPTHQSLSACEAVGIPHRNIIAMQGPFTTELNLATLRQYMIRFLVTKDGGNPGGFPEKAEAAHAAGAVLIVLERPAESGEDFDVVYNLCITLLQSGDANIIFTS